MGLKRKILKFMSDISKDASFRYFSGSFMGKIDPRDED